MLNAALISLIILLYTLQSFWCKKYTDSYPGKADNASPVFTVVSGLTVVVVAFVMSGFTFSAKPLTILLGVANALVLAGYNYFIIKCSQLGPYSILMVFNLAGGISLPAVFAVLAFGDEMSLWKALAILAVFASVYMVSYRKEEKESKKSRGFLLCCLALGICNGAYGVLFDAQQRLTGADEKEEMVALTFGIAATICFILLLVKEKKATLPAFRQNRRSLVYLIACSLVVASAINLLVYILRLVDVTLLYTLDNAGVLLLSVLASAIFFKEKLSKLNAIGCITMCIALVCVSIF